MNPGNRLPTRAGLIQINREGLLPTYLRDHRNDYLVRGNQCR